MHHGRLGGRHPENAAAAQHVLYVPLVAIGILHGVDDDDRAVQDHARGGILSGRELVHHCQGGLGARALAAVNGVAEPHDGRQTTQNRGFVAIEQSQGMRIVLDLAQPRLVCLTRDEDLNDGPAFECARYRIDVHAPAGRRESRYIQQDLVVRCEAVADIVSKHSARRRHGGIVAAALAVGVLRAERRGQGERGKREKQTSHEV